MRYARHRQKTWAEMHEETAILLVVIAIGLLMGLCVFGNIFY